jgi:Carboxypeptidase regulatory-like domain
MHPSSRSQCSSVNILILLLTIGALALPIRAEAQDTGGLHGQVFDSTDALIARATLTLTHESSVFHSASDETGTYAFRSLPSASYSLRVDAPGFATFSKENISISSGQIRQLNVTLRVAVQNEDVQVSEQSGGVSVNPDENANATTIKGADLEALADDPDQLRNELQALAGPAAGPNGGQIYIDGYTGGQIPPRSSIREIRVNQNPFSAEFDQIGYGRIEILTKPGSDKFSGNISADATDSAFNTGNPLVTERPDYYQYFFRADVNGPVSKHASYFFSVLNLRRHNQNIVNAIDPQNTIARLSDAVPNPSSLLSVNPRMDFQLGSNNTVSIRNSYTRSVQTDAGIGALNLAQQAYDSNDQENAFQASDTVVVNSHLINETRFQWRRIRNRQSSNYVAPAVTVQGAFTAGGNGSGVVQDHQDDLELQNISTLVAGAHAMRFGVRLRSYRAANYSTTGVNGTYVFQSISEYLARAPNQYSVTLVKNPLARATLFDSALFLEDDWRWRPNVTFSFGIRFEGQNRISDHADWAPRLALAWAPGGGGSTKPKRVFRAGYGWFYNRFIVPTSFNSTTGTPYIIQAIHQNGLNQRSFVVNNPSFYNPGFPVLPDGSVGTGSTPSAIYTVDPHFHGALNMQAAVGMDQQLSKRNSFNVTYLYTQGNHQYRSNNITAPAFDPSSYTITGPTPDIYNYQFQSGGNFKQHQLIVTVATQFRRISLHTTYTFNNARSDTQGVNSFPSISSNPRLDYGRASFDIHNRLLLIATYTTPYKVVIAPFLAAQSGTPYNLTIGSDLTGNNQFNARPTYGTCGEADVVSTRYGCLDMNPVGRGEKIIPYNLGSGPANIVMNLRVSRSIGIGPKFANNAQGNGGSREIPRKYSATFLVGAFNLFNIVNLGAPDGVLSSPLFGTSQSLATGPFASPSAGNRSVFLQTRFSF